MSLGIYAQPPVEEAFVQVIIEPDEMMPEPKGALDVLKNTYIFSQQSAPHKTALFPSYILQMGAKMFKGNSPMHLFSTTATQARAIRGEARIDSKSPADSFSTPQTALDKPSAKQTSLTSPNQEAKPNQPHMGTSMPAVKTVIPQQQGVQGRLDTARSGERTAAGAQTRGQSRIERSENRNQLMMLQSRQWKKEETVQWWQERYHQKERDGQKQGQEQQQQEQNPDKKKKKDIAGVVSASANKSQPTQVYRSGGNDKIMKKPVLRRPKTGIFALYYILTKIGIFSDGTSNFSYKQDIESVDAETTKAHKKRLDELKVAIEKEKAAAQWGLAVKAFSWMGSMMGLVTGIALVASGVGVVAGAMLIVGGVIQLANQMLSITGGWKKIVELLPGDDPERKRAVVNWMQIGISVLCLILSGAGILWGGYANFNEGMRTAMSLFGAVVTTGYGASNVGEGVTVFMFKNKMGEVRRYDKILADLKHKRQDLMERVEWGIDRLEQLFEDLARTLEFEIELFRADQMIYR